MIMILFLFLKQADETYDFINEETYTKLKERKLPRRFYLFIFVDYEF